MQIDDAEVIYCCYSNKIIINRTKVLFIEPIKNIELNLKSLRLGP